MAHWHSANVPERSTSRDSCTFSMCLKMVYSKGVFLHTWRYTVSNDPGTCSKNTRLRFRASREGRVLTALGVASGIKLRTGIWITAIETHDAQEVFGSNGGFAMFFNWATISALIGILGWIIAILMLFIVPVNRKPSSATAWLLLIFLLPYFGLILFLLLGSPKLPKRRRAEHHNMS